MDFVLWNAGLCAPLDGNHSGIVEFELSPVKN